MFYRENGQFKTSYSADQQIFAITQDRWLILALIVFYLILGMFMDVLSMQVATIPITYPIALAIDVRSEVRAATAEVVTSRRRADELRRVLVPTRERIVALSQQHYDAMLLGVHQLLMAKQSEVNAYREYIEAVRDYWIARAELSRATGGKLE